jgi:hypothetical protein
MRFIIFAILALLSLFLSLICLGYLFASCVGHPPTTEMGVWIFPASFLGFGAFLYLSLLFWKARQRQAVDSLPKKAKHLTRKISILLGSFLVATFVFSVLMWLFIYIGMGLFIDFAPNTAIPDWTVYPIYALCASIALATGVGTYKYMIRRHV